MCQVSRSKRRDHPTHVLIAGHRGPPGRAVPPLVIEGTVGTGDKDIKPVWSPCRPSWLRHTDPTHVLVVGHRRAPSRAVPPLVIERAVGAQDKHIKPVRAP